MVERRAASLEEQARRRSQALSLSLEIRRVTLEESANRDAEPLPACLETGAQLLLVGNDERSGSGRSRRARVGREVAQGRVLLMPCLLYTSPSPRDRS